MSAAAAQKFSELAEAFEEVRSQLKDLADDPDVLQGDRIATSLGKLRAVSKMSSKLFQTRVSKQTSAITSCSTASSPCTSFHVISRGYR
jgi:hypothetical protein